MKATTGIAKTDYLDFRPPICAALFLFFSTLFYDFTAQQPIPSIQRISSLLCKIIEENHFLSEIGTKVSEIPVFCISFDIIEAF